MAKTRTSRKKPAKKAAARRKKVSSTMEALPARQQAKALRKLKKLSLPPSHPSDITGPALELNYEAPMPKVSTRKKASKTAKKRKR